MTIPGLGFLQGLLGGGGIPTQGLGGFVPTAPLAGAVGGPQPIAPVQGPVGDMIANAVLNGPPVVGDLTVQAPLQAPTAESVLAGTTPKPPGIGDTERLLFQLGAAGLGAASDQDQARGTPSSAGVAPVARPAAGVPVVGARDASTILRALLFGGDPSSLSGSGPFR